MSCLMVHNVVKLRKVIPYKENAVEEVNNGKA